MSATEHPHRTPAQGDELELTVDSLAHGGAGVARTRRLRGVRARRACRATASARASRSRSAPSARRDSVELLEPSPDRIEPRAPHPGAPWQVLPYERQLAEKEAQVRDALERIGGFEDPPVEPIVAAERAAALPQQARVLVRRRTRAASSCSASTARAAGTLIDDVDRRRPRLRARRRAARGRQGLVPRGGAVDLGPPRRRAACCATSSCARGGAAASCRRGSSPARATSASRSWPPPMPADGVLWTQAAGVAETTREGETRC